ncbi:MAG: hypothetical protein HY885_16200 [Deltaproteobacteria bacterium]|nr:hypothetical protein [Deltaproteobacteria bacterium]
MNEIDRLQLLAELTREFCELNHGPNVRREDFPATDYIVMPFGYAENEMTEVAAREMVVPVCYDCATALLGNEWTLLYCFECCSSQWICRRFAKNSYQHHILWLRGCPHCTHEFGGLYFNDFKAVTDGVGFLREHMGIMAA